MKELESVNFFESQKSIAYDEIIKYKYPWDAVAKIKDIITSLIPTLDENYEKISEGVYVFKGVKIPKTACIMPPCIICEGAEIRNGAFIRGNVIVGKGAVVGNSSELKNAILFDSACVPHFNYVGDSIIGYKSHLGAGAIISNLKGNNSSVSIKRGGEKIETKMRKLGAIIGDNVEVGCGTVLNPGTVIFSGAQIYPLQSVRGVIERCIIYKSENNTVKREGLCAE